MRVSLRDLNPIERLNSIEHLTPIGLCSAQFAEKTAQPVARIPDGVTDQQAAALPIPAITALGSLELLGIAAGQKVVVTGATGGVGGYAVQMARSRGAHVIATVRGDAEEARRLGAAEVV
jgi:NADPH:quinone reductase-like Zn-dependent oxidoreductase